MPYYLFVNYTYIPTRKSIFNEKQHFRQNKNLLSRHLRLPFMQDEELALQLRFDTCCELLKLLNDASTKIRVAPSRHLQIHYEYL